MARPYVLPNRKAFADAVARIFLKYPLPPQTQEDKDVDVCLTRGASSRELLPHQKIVRDYLAIETPYRGLLLYHGLGSGKTCSSIAVAESLLSTRKVYVILPASLQQNYINELQSCGAPLYLYDHHWRQQSLNPETQALAKQMGISEGFLSKQNMFFTTVSGEEPNYKQLPKSAQDVIQAQFTDVLKSRFTFIRYNGLTSANIDTYVPPDGSNPYEDSVVIIDEVHNFISRVLNESAAAGKLYDLLYSTKTCKIVALSGTPVINRANEIAYLMNLLRGAIERYIVPVKTVPTWDEEKMKTVLTSIPDIDTIEFDALKRHLLLTRNPPNFETVYNEKGERLAVRYNKDLTYPILPQDWVRSWKERFERESGGSELDADRVVVETHECLPSDYDEFAKLFLDGLKIKNPMLLKRRIQGLVSYYKGADERVLPKIIESESMVEKVPMSAEQYLYYLDVRSKELTRNKRKPTIATGDNEMKTFRVLSRLACNYMIPPDMREAAEKEVEDMPSEDKVVTKELVLQKLLAKPENYLSSKALETFSPKMLRMLKNIEETRGTGDVWNNQFVYSQYQSLEGLGVFRTILDANGWQQFRLVKEGDQWIVDKTLDPKKPAYSLYIGGQGSAYEDEREYLRQIFNGPEYEIGFPPSLRASVEALPKKLLCLFMASSAGAEGITLRNVRRVHIMEPHWNPARHEQVIGRAVRICSHAGLLPEDRTVRVSFYMSVLNKEQAGSVENNAVLIRKSDMVMKRYEGDPVETFMTTDEYLYEISYEKEVTNREISTLLKQSAVDCEVHRKFHGRETPVMTCMRFEANVTGEDLAFKTDVKLDELDDSYLRNNVKRSRKLQKVSIKGIVFFIDPATKEVFDGHAYEDNKRLLRLGMMTSSTSIQWLLP